MNGQSKFSKAFSSGACIRCCKVGKYKHKYLRDNWPKIKKAPEPSNILWKNLSVDGLTRSCRSLVVWIFGILLVIGTLAAIFFATKYRQTHEDKFSFIDCFNFEVAPSQAYEDYIREPDLRTGYLSCYCFSQFRQLSFDVLNLKYDNGNSAEAIFICKDWFYGWAVDSGFIVATGLFISIMNLII